MPVQVLCQPKKYRQSSNVNCHELPGGGLAKAYLPRYLKYPDVGR
jgi:hypothetical protein